mgnify:CR=1 FL=1|tara:strand:+ start:45 stop:443 length:399 start_codon:yes stop_codon:yes gene_type:complete
MRTKTSAKKDWLKNGLNPDDFEKAWAAYCKSTNCDWCKRGYKSQRDKQMDHCHTFHHFRNILCHTCNSWRSNPINICKSLRKSVNKYYYIIRITRNGKYILNTKRNTYKKAEAVLLEFKINNGFYFPFFNSD